MKLNKRQMSKYMELDYLVRCCKNYTPKQYKEYYQLKFNIADNKKNFEAIKKHNNQRAKETKSLLGL